MSRLTTPPRGNVLFFTAVNMVFITVFLFVSLNVGWAGETTRILVVPFGVNAPRELSYIKQGISDMLTSRLEKNPKVVVIVADEDAGDLKALCQKTGAAYLVTGSVTIVGDSVSTDAQLVKSAALDAPVLSFSKTGGRQTDLIGLINELAESILTGILGQQPEQTGSLPASAPTVDGAAPQAGVAAPQPFSMTATPGRTAADFKSAANRPGSGREVVRVPGVGTIEGQVRGITAGDIDGDGTAEMVTITDDHLFIHCFKKGRWVKLAEHDSPGDFVGVDAADVNHNGKQELFVTRFSQTENKVYSFVLEWDGHGLERIASQLPWYFRSVDIYNRGLVLVAQRQIHAKRFSSGIYEIEWKNDAYTMGESLSLPSNLNVFGFAYGAVRTQEQPEVVRYNSDGFIQIIGPTGEDRWVSAEHYGGGANAVTFMDESQWDVQDIIYLPPRIRLYDVDNDGIQEMLVVNNQNSFTGSGVLERHRFYAKGRLQMLKWQNEGIRTVGQTLDMARFIADFTLIDIDGDQKLDFVAAIVVKTEGMAAKGSSFLASVSMN